MPRPIDIEDYRDRLRDLAYQPRFSVVVPVYNPPPGFLEAEIDVRGRRVHVYCTHLDYRADPSVRALQVGDTTKILAQNRAAAA